MHLLCAFLAITAITLQQHSKARLLIEVSNNGARSPIIKDDYSKRPWAKDHLHGEITNVGLRSHYLIGRTLRKFYVDIGLLPSSYNTDQISVFAAPYSAAESSAYAQLMGLYTPGFGPILSEIQQSIAIPPVEDMDTVTEVTTQLKDKALPYYSNTFAISKESDLLFNTISECNFVRTIVENFMVSDQYKKINQSYSELYKRIETNNPSLKGKMNISSANSLYDIYKCDINDDRSMNLILSTEDVSELETLHLDFIKNVLYENTTTLASSVHYMVNKWIYYINDAMDKDNSMVKTSTKMVYYSGIPTIMYPLMLTMKLNSKYLSKISLDFASTLMILLVATKESPPYTLMDYEISLRWDGITVESALGLQMPAKAGDFITALNKIDIHLAQFNVSTMEQFCAINIKPPTPPGPAPEIGLKWKHVMWACFGVSLFLIVLAWIVVHTKDSIKEKILAEEKGFTKLA